jgi:beta-lactamase regulating signal transducer with metallopeptidase domain
MKIYIGMNLLTIIGFSIWIQISKTSLENNRSLLRVTPSQALKLGYLVIACILSLPWVFLILYSLFLKEYQFFPSIQMWSPGESPLLNLSLHTSSLSESLGPQPHAASLPNWTGPSLFNILVSSPLFLGLFFSVYQTYSDQKKLKKILKESFPIRKLGRVEILVRNEIDIPFSFWNLRHAYIVLPESLLSSSSHLRLAVAHEIQHHRQGDTQWMYVVQMMKGIFLIHPLLLLFRIFEKNLSKIQEFACDEALISRKSVSPHAYGSCLFQVAQSAVRPRSQLVGTASMGASTSAHILKRRIEMMFKYQKHPRRNFNSILMGTLIVVVLSTAAWANSQGSSEIQISRDQAIEMAKQVKSRVIPIEVNDQVVAQLNRYLATPESRKSVLKTLERMKTHQPMIEKHLKAYNLPKELLAIPFAESAYENKIRGVGAGLWAFIKTTARSYDLTVNESTDERLLPEEETIAAMKYYTDLFHGRPKAVGERPPFPGFKRWDFALLAYNMGEQRVMQGIQKTGSTNVWQLLEAGYTGDKDYYPTVIAAMIIVANESKIAQL